MDPALIAQAGGAASSAPDPTEDAAPVWRPEDERLLERLGDERAVAAVWALDAPRDTPALPRRASVLARAVRQLDGGQEPVLRASEGDAGDLSRWIRRSPVGGPPLFCHAAAIYFARLAAACESACARQLHASAGYRRTQLDARIRSMAMWIALVEEKTFLTETATKISAGTLGAAEAELEAQGAADRVLEELERIATKGAKDLSAAGAAALEALGRAHDACRMASASGADAKSFAKRADRARARAIDEALSSSEDTLADASARGAGTREHRAILGRVREIWGWSGRDEAVERFAVDQVTPLAWEIYRRSAWPELLDLLSQCEPLYESFEARQLAHPEEITYAAKCAQILVFRSEAQTDRAKEWAFAERALKVCPWHRNGRLTMAHLLAEQAITQLFRINIFSAKSDIAQVTALVERAEKLFPQSTRTQEARVKLDEAKTRWGGGAK